MLWSVHKCTLFIFCCGNTLSKLLKMTISCHWRRNIYFILSTDSSIMLHSLAEASFHLFRLVPVCLLRASLELSWMLWYFASSLPQRFPSLHQWIPFLHFPLTVKWPMSGFVQMYADFSCKKRNKNKNNNKKQKNPQTNKKNLCFICIPKSSI